MPVGRGSPGAIPRFEALQSERIHERGELLSQSHHSHLAGDSGVSPAPKRASWPGSQVRPRNTLAPADAPPPLFPLFSLLKAATICPLASSAHSPEWVCVREREVVCV